jgi:hypothetical protein
MDKDNTFPATWNGSAWGIQTVVTIAATSHQVTGVMALREYAIGQSVPLMITTVQATYSDPINSMSNPKAIPGAIKQYTLELRNPGLPTTTNTLVVTQPIASNLSFYVNDMGGSGSWPVLFTQGTPTSGLSYTFTSLASGTDDIDFSNNGGATWTYTPTPGGNGCDSAVTNIRVRPQGSSATGQSVNPRPNFKLVYRTCIN